MQVKELLLPFGSLKAFNLVMDKNTGNSKVCSWSSLAPSCMSCMWTAVSGYPPLIVCLDVHGPRPGPDVVCL